MYGGYVESEGPRWQVQGLGSEPDMANISGKDGSSIAFSR